MFVVESRFRSCLALLVALSGLGCASESDGGPAPAPAPTEEPAPTYDLSFDLSDDIVLGPRQPKQIGVSVQPPGAYPVRFALLSEAGKPHDGVLDRVEVWTNAKGRASVEFTAPSAPTTLLLRAITQGAPPIEKRIRVTATGSTTLRVQASYSGRRPVKQWVAGVHFDKRCEDFTTMPPNDGDLFAPSQTAPIDVPKVPVGNRPMAVTLRAGRYLSGCANREGAVEGTINLIYVPVTAVPLQLESTVLDVVIGLKSSDATLDESLDQALVLARSKLRGAASDDVAALLDAMRDSLPAAQGEAFSAARDRYGWDDAVVEAVGESSLTALGDALERWTAMGRSAWFSPHAFEGRLRASKSSPGRPELTIERAAGQPASELGLAADETSWEADASDKIAFGGSLTWSASHFLVGLATPPALSETGSASLLDALSRIENCPTVAATLIRPGSTVTGCDEACLEDLCGLGAAALWDSARRASGGELERLALTASGSATVGNEAQAVALDGSWIGRLSSSGGSTGGSLVGFAPRAP
ncbi:MAG: hypothetical protein M3020_14705 [Myxococcota bacterium]|nr:hypothetical protein [Myxococcota bacterium]